MYSTTKGMCIEISSFRTFLWREICLKLVTLDCAGNSTTNCKSKASDVALLTRWPRKFISILKTHTPIRLTLKRLTFFHWQFFCINSFTMNILLTTKNDMSRLWAELIFRITKIFSKKFVRNFKLISPGSRKLLIRGLWIRKTDLHGKGLWKFIIIDAKIKSKQILYLKSQLLNKF